MSDDYNYYSSDTSNSVQSRFKHSSKLLLIIFVLLIPSLAILYVSTRFEVRIFYLSALWLNLFLIGCAGIVLAISAVLGVIEERKFERLANPNTHPRPRR